MLAVCVCVCVGLHVSWLHIEIGVCVAGFILKLGFQDPDLVTGLAWIPSSCFWPRLGSLKSFPPGTLNPQSLLFTFQPFHMALFPA
jgi:hypothetical protein